MDSYRMIIGIVAILAALVLADSNRFADPDLFCHLYSGKEIVEQGRVPRTDTHSFSVPGGKWTDYEWGARALFYGLYEKSGSGGIVVLRVILSLMIFLFLFISAWKISGSIPLASLSTLLCAAASHRYFLFRPQLFTFFFLALLLFILTSCQRFLPSACWKEKRRWFLILPVLFLVWANVHAGFPLGLFIFALFLFSEFAGEKLLGKLRMGRAAAGDPSAPGDLSEDPTDPRNVKGGKKRFLLPIAGLFLLSCLATLLNPYGIGLWRGILGTIFGTFTPEISEWKPVYAFPFLTLFWFYFFFVVYLLAFVASRQKRLLDLLLFIFLAYLAITKVRFIPLFAIILAPSLARYLRGMMERISPLEKISSSEKTPSLEKSSSFRDRALEMWRPEGQAWKWVTLVVLVIPFIVKGAQGEIHPHLKIFKTDFFQPVTAVKMMKANGLSGDIMNEYDWGGYIRWELPQCRIFVDGRSDTVYPHETIKEWASFVNGEERWSAILDQYAADAILIRTQHPVNERLKRSEKWRLVYYDDICSFYVNMESSRNAPFFRKWLSNSLSMPEVSDRDYKL